MKESTTVLVSADPVRCNVCGDSGLVPYADGFHRPVDCPNCVLDGHHDHGGEG